MSFGTRTVIYPAFGSKFQHDVGNQTDEERQNDYQITLPGHGAQLCTEKHQHDFRGSNNV